MPSLQTEVIVNAPIDSVWRALLHKDDWMYWNTYLYDCSFRIPFREGESVILSLRRMDGDDPVEFEAKVRILQPPFCLSWVAVAVGFRCRVTFDLEDLGMGCTKVRFQESFSGMFSRFVVRWVRGDELAGMRRMGRELKVFVERSR
jgi:hypothetical protein